MTNLGHWAISVGRRSVGTFILATVGALVGVGLGDVVGIVDVGNSGWSPGDVDHYVAALATGVGTVLIQQILPAVRELGTKLQATPKKGLKI